MNVLRLIIERWFDKRYTKAIVSLLGNDERFLGRFNPEQTSIYRMPLPFDPQVTIEFASEITYRFKRSFLEIFGLGDRIYVADSAPLGLFEKPVALFVFRGLFGKPRIAQMATFHIFLNDNPIPFFDPDVLRERAIYNIGSIPKPNVLGTVLVYSSLGPLIGSFPGDDVPPPDPEDDFQPPSIETPGAIDTGSDETIMPTSLFRGLCFQNPLVNPNESGSDHLWGEVVQVRAAFKNRGYDASARCAHKDHLRKFKQMMDWLREDLAQQVKYCNQKNDQLVILLAAHGSNGCIEYRPEKNIEEKVSIRQFYEELANIPRIAAHPEKVILLVKSCKSGQFFIGEIPGVLSGLHVMTSSPNDSNSYGDEFDEWICEALNSNNARTWRDFVAKVKWAAGRDSDRKGPIPKNGDLCGCRVKVTLTSTTYTGTDLGGEWWFELELNDHKTVTDWHTVPFNGTAPEGYIVYDYFVGQPPKKVKLKFQVHIKIRGPQGEADNYQYSEKEIICEKTDIFYHKHKASLSKSMRIAHLEFDYRIDTSCF